MSTRNGDLHTVLRHLVDNTNWGGNQGEKTETYDALDRLTDDNYADGSGEHPKDADDNQDETPADPSTNAPHATSSATPVKSVPAKSARR